MKEITDEDMSESILVAAGFGTREGTAMAAASKDLKNAVELIRAAGHAAKLCAIRTAAAKDAVLMLLVGSPEDLVATERELSKIDPRLNKST